MKLSKVYITVGIVGAFATGWFIPHEQNETVITTVHKVSTSHEATYTQQSSYDYNTGEIYANWVGDINVGVINFGKDYLNGALDISSSISNCTVKSLSVQFDLNDGTFKDFFTSSPIKIKSHHDGQQFRIEDGMIPDQSLVKDVTVSVDYTY